MHAEDWQTEEIEIEGFPVTIRSYRLYKTFVSEIESTAAGSLIARGISNDPSQSRRDAIEAAGRRLFRDRLLTRCVGG